LSSLSGTIIASVVAEHCGKLVGCTVKCKRSNLRHSNGQTLVSELWRTGGWGGGGGATRKTYVVGYADVRSVVVSDSL